MIASPSPFLAKHQYFPESFLLVSKPRVSPSATELPSFIHVIVGVGFPVAVQRKVTFIPSTTVWLLGLAVKLGGTETMDKSKTEWAISHFFPAVLNTRLVIVHEKENDKGPITAFEQKVS